MKKKKGADTRNIVPAILIYRFIAGILCLDNAKNQYETGMNGMPDNEKGLKAMDEPAIPVFFNTDDGYVVPTYIALFSLLTNYRGSSTIYAYILTAGDISEKNTQLLNSLSDRFSQVKIRIVDVPNIFSSVSIKQKHISTASLYRLMIPLLADSLSEVRMDRCIYLDSDLIVAGNIANLFSLDVEDNYVGGVGDIFQMNSADRYKLRIPSMEKYINSGVLLFNLSEISQTRELRDRLIEAGCNDDYYFKDQDAINTVLFEKIKLLPLKYNVMASEIYRNDTMFFQQYGKKNVEDAKKNPVIIHYITIKKPWAYRTAVLAEKWWTYVRMQDENILREYIDPFIKAHRLPFHLLALEECMTILKHSGIWGKLYHFIMRWYAKHSPHD